MSTHILDGNHSQWSDSKTATNEFIIHALLTWRVMSLLTLRHNRDGSNRAEAGPYDILNTFRKWAGVNYAGQPQTTEIAKALTCIYCASFWIGLAVALLAGKGLGYGLALSTAAVMIERYQFGG